MGTAPIAEKQKIKKRKYSRKGCKECKRRKIKCDEATPTCNNCARLFKLCTYETNQKFKHESIEERDQLSLKPGESTQLATKELTMKFYDPTLKNGRSPQLFNSVQSPRTLALLASQLGNGQILSPTESGMGMVSPGVADLDMQNLFDEASLLVHDINHMLESDLMLDISGFPSAALLPGGAESTTRQGSGNTPNSSASENHFKIKEFSNTIHHDNEDSEAYVNPSGIREQLKLSNSELIDKCISENSLVEPHIRYLQTLTTTDLSYHLYPFASLIESNEVVKLLLTYLSKCPYLLTSLLAISATFQFNQTGKVAHDTARQKYITVCLKTLGEAFTENSGFRNAAFFSSHIEKLLLTVVVLTSYFTATTCLLNDNVLNSWKAHLRGARDLLLNYSKIAKGTFETPTPFMSGGLALAKCWFFALESVATVHSAMGGTLAKTKSSSTNIGTLVNGTKVQNDNSHIYLETGCFEHRDNPGYHEALRRVNMICSSPGLSDFNLFWGFSSKTVKTILCYSQIMDALRLKEVTHVPLQWIAHLMGLVNETAQEEIVPGVLPKTFEIPTASRGHPEYLPEHSRLQYPPSCHVRDTDDTGRPLCFSWFDASQQLHIDFMYLKILVSLRFLALPRTHPHVQELVRKVFDGAFFIKSKSSSRYELDKDKIVVESDHFYLSQPSFDNRCIMVQSAFRLCSGVVIEDEDFEKIELFFMGLMKLGNGSSLNALDAVVKFRECRKAKKEEIGDATDDEIYGDDARMVDLPFA